MQIISNYFTWMRIIFCLWFLSCYIFLKQIKIVPSKTNVTFLPLQSRDTTSKHKITRQELNEGGGLKSKKFLTLISKLKFYPYSLLLSSSTKSFEVWIYFSFDFNPLPYAEDLASWQMIKMRALVNIDYPYFNSEIRNSLFPIIFETGIQTIQLGPFPTMWSKT